VKPHCPKHGPLSHHCHKNNNNRYYNGGGGGSGGGNATNSTMAPTNGWQDPDFDDYDFGQFGANTLRSAEDNNNELSGNPISRLDRFTLWMIIAAAAAASVAAVRIYLRDNRRDPPVWQTILEKAAESCFKKRGDFLTRHCFRSFSFCLGYSIYIYDI